MSRLQFEYSPLLVFLCLALGLAYAYWLYTAKHPWGQTLNRLLFALRAALVAILAFLLLGPVLKWIQTKTEKPAFVFLVDNSRSVAETTDSLQREAWWAQLMDAKQRLEENGHDVEVVGLNESDPRRFQQTASDLSTAMRTQLQKYEGKNLAGLVLLSDGLYNEGTSPLYLPLRQPVYTVGVGDTTARTDVAIQSLVYNKIAYQGNRFPLRAEVRVTGRVEADITVTLSRDGKQLARQTQPVNGQSLLVMDFQVNAETTGLQRLEVSATVLPTERNTRNNRASAFVEVVAGKRQILLVAPAPHPDIKALRSVVDQNPNYELIVHIPGISQTDAALLTPGQAQLAIFHQPLDREGKTAALFSTFVKSQTSLLLLLGPRTRLEQLPPQGIGLSFASGNPWDQVTAVVNPAFRDFVFTEKTPGVFASFPPVQVPFGKFGYPPQAQVLLYQQIGSIVTERPLLLSWEEGSRKIAALTGEGLWRWRLREYADHSQTAAFDEVFSKLMQYLSTTDDKRRFRSFPLKNEFTTAEPVTFESQVYNALFEPIFGFPIALEIAPDEGPRTPYSYVTGPGSSRYRVGDLKEGIYRYRASTVLEGKREEVTGQFLVTQQRVESQNLTADFGLLRKLAAETNGRFYTAAQLNELPAAIVQQQAKAILRTQEEFNPLIHSKWLFALLVLLIALEWFLRKYAGAY
ncbi:MAG: hypothetical protein MUC38_11545 [Cyclobacteriaceae bacterium]|jgi:hypothetical protein|nr:hypothetical protein [Cyclobacteriaceae bacterium]